jgi:hypothetical protein
MSDRQECRDKPTLRFPTLAGEKVDGAKKKKEVAWAWQQ